MATPIVPKVHLSADGKTPWCHLGRGSKSLILVTDLDAVTCSRCADPKNLLDFVIELASNKTPAALRAVQAINLKMDLCQSLLFRMEDAKKALLDVLAKTKVLEEALTAAGVAVPFAVHKMRQELGG
jgi:hypothetical protein